MGIFKEFKDFAMKGNVVDLAVAVIIGGAFQKIVGALVKNVLMPAVSVAMGGVSFDSLFITLDGNAYETLKQAQEAGAAVLQYGLFIQAIIDFIIVAFVIFMVVKGINASKKKEAEAPAEPPKPSEDVLLLREIRDSLKK